MTCGDFNMHKAPFSTPHTPLCQALLLWIRGLHQLLSFLIRQSAILDLILSEHSGTTAQLPNLNTSDHVAIFISLQLLLIFQLSLLHLV